MAEALIATAWALACANGRQGSRARFLSWSMTTDQHLEHEPGACVGGDKDGLQGRRS